jgi:cell division control protein 45
MSLHTAILRTGTALIEKRQIRTLRAFRLAIVKEGPDLAIFTHPNALSKLALWISEAVLEQEREQDRKKHLPLVIASLNERRGIYIVVGMAIGAQVANTVRIQRKRKEKEEIGERRRKLEEEGLEVEEEEDISDEEEEEDGGKRGGRNRFGIAFQDVANSTQARIRIDSFEATVVEVKKDDLGGFLEGLSLRSVVG